MCEITIHAEKRVHKTTLTRAPPKIADRQGRSAHAEKNQFLAEVKAKLSSEHVLLLAQIINSFRRPAVSIVQRGGADHQFGFEARRRVGRSADNQTEESSPW
jgi:acetyl-CoA carboxylase carboxyltransferase component